MIFSIIRKVAPNITNLEQRHEGHAEIRVLLFFLLSELLKFLNKAK